MKLLPLADDGEKRKFRKKIRRFMRILGPLALGKVLDAEGRPAVWYAVDCNDAAAVELLLDQGAALSAFAPVAGGESASGRAPP